jgi:hypothetical protein
MRSTHVALAVLIGSASGIACTTPGYENYTPPPQPPSIKTLTLTAAAHELADANDNFVHTSYTQLGVAKKIWQSCAIAVVFKNILIDVLNGVDPEDPHESVRFGERFPAEYPNKDVHGTNFSIVEAAGFNANATTRRGSDEHWTKAVQVYLGGVPNLTNTLGVTRVSPGPDNFSVLRNLSNGQNQLILAHEIGHQLGLADLEPAGNNGNLMCKNIECAGTTLTGNTGTSNPRAQYTQCGTAEQWGDYWDLYEEK